MALINELKGKTLTESFKGFIGSFITEEAEKYLTKEKTLALEKNADFQQKKKELAKMRAEILANVTNKLYAHKLAVNFGYKWGIDTDVLESMIIDKNGECVKDGKKVTLSTISECASFMVYLYKNMTRTAKKGLDKRHEIYIAVCGGLEWNDDLNAVCERVAKMQNIATEDVLNAYKAEKAKAEKAEAEAK